MRISVIRTVLVWVLSISVSLMPGFAFSFPATHLNSDTASWSQDSCSQNRAAPSLHASSHLMTADVQCHSGSASLPDGCGTTCIVSVGMLNEAAIDFLVFTPQREMIPFQVPFYSTRRMSLLYRPPKS